MSNEQTWIERLRRAASSAEADAEVYRQQRDVARKKMQAELQRRDELLDAITDLIEARAKVKELADG